MIVAVLTILFSLIWHSVGYCEGSWQTLTHNEGIPHIHAARTAHDPLEAKGSNAKWLEQACPAQMAVYTCYFHGNVTRARELEMRRYVPHPPTAPTPPSSSSDEQCHAFHAIELLELLRNKHVVFIGDSILTQLWVSLVCLLGPLTQTQLSIHWGRMFHCNDITCPAGDSNEHSLIGNSWAYLPSSNTSFVLEIVPEYNLKAIQHIYSTHRLTATDLVIMNFGVHYNKQEEFGHAIGAFMRGVVGEMYKHQPQPIDMEAGADGSREDQAAWKSHLPPILYFQTAPQHFGGESGYYQGKDSNVTNCEPVSARIKDIDWRNRILDEHLGTNDSNSPVHLVRTADALYSQYDAHVASNPYPSEPMDCTHWCFPSGIFNYLQLMLYNAVYRLADHSVGGYGFYGPELREGDLVKRHGAAEVYLLSNGQRRPFDSLQAFVSRGYDFSNVITIAGHALNEIPLGEALK